MGYYVFQNNSNDDADDYDDQQADLVFLSYQYVQRKDVNHLFNVLKKDWCSSVHACREVVAELLAFSGDPKVRFFSFGSRMFIEPFFLLNGSGWYEVINRLLYCVTWSSTPGPNKTRFKCKVSVPSHHRVNPYQDLTDNRNSLRDQDSGDDEDYAPSDAGDYAPPRAGPSKWQPPRAIVDTYSEEPLAAFYENVSWLHYEIFERCKCFTQLSFEDNFDLEWVN